MDKYVLDKLFADKHCFRCFLCYNTAEALDSLSALSSNCLLVLSSVNNIFLVALFQQQWSDHVREIGSLGGDRFL